MSNITFQPLGDPLAAGERLENIADIDPRMTRTHYFDGRLLTAEDLERDQIYLDQRLREVGKVLGQGILRGLDISYDKFTGLLTVSAGQAVTSAGRVLHLGSSLIVDLGDRALISQLNSGHYRRFNRALFAVVLRYVEVATDVAEVFPTNLASKRGADYALVTESVQLGLVQLPTRLPQQDPLHIRAGLIRELLGNAEAEAFIPEDGVALGILAIQNDTPQWLDSQLLRHPLRSDLSPGDLQQDLSRQYEALLTDIMTARQTGSLNNNFAARDYVDLLPPAGSLPLEAVNPVNGYQRFFPDDFDVHIAPIRQAELALIKAESMALPNIKLATEEDTEIVILVPLSNQVYGHYARQLERDYNPVTRDLPQHDLLRLKLYPTRPVHEIDTDATVWQAIWDQLETDKLTYVRRPVRAAETSVSGIILAMGIDPPQPSTGDGDSNQPGDSGTGDGSTGDGSTGEGGGDGDTSTGDGSVGEGGSGGETGSGDGPTTPGDSGGSGDTGSGSIIEDEDTVFLRFLNFKLLGQIRQPTGNESSLGLEKLHEEFGKDAQTVRLINNILLRVERHYDPVIWQTLNLGASNGALEEMLNELMQITESSPVATGKVIVNMAGALNMQGGLENEWVELVNQINN